jgi:colicin import membrane protein
MTATTMDGFAAQNRKFLIVSTIGHVLLLAVASSNLLEIPRQPMTRLAIEAVVIDQSTLQRTTPADRRKAEEAAQRKRDEAAQQQRREQEQKAQQAKDRQAAEQRKQQDATAAAERQRADKQRKDSEAKAADAQQQKKVEAERKQQVQRETEAKAQAEQARVAAAAKAKANAEKADQARRQAELMASMEAEEGLMEAARSGELSRYLALIQQKVERNWVPPATVKEGLECEVAVVQLPNGDVVDARTVTCNGDAAVQRSIENAVRRSSPLPLPDNRALFERNLRFIFKPQQ